MEGDDAPIAELAKEVKHLHRRVEVLSEDVSKVQERLRAISEMLEERSQH